MAEVLVVGGGPAGCASAHFLSDAGHEVTLIERTGVLGGSSRTYYHYGHPYTLGPRHFLTKQERVWAFLNEHCPMKLFKGHEFLTYVGRDFSVAAQPENNIGGGFWHFPIHRDEVDLMPDAAFIRGELANVPGAGLARNLEEYWLFSVGERLYDKFVNGYSQKMWPDARNTDIEDFKFTPKGVALKTGPIRAAWSESMSGFPLAVDGYDTYWSRSTLHTNVHTYTQIDEYDLDKRRVRINGDWSNSFDIVILTISPENVFLEGGKPCFGELRWMGREFHKVVLPTWHLPNKQVFPEHVYFLYYANEEPFTRAVEYSKFYDNGRSPPDTTLIGFEIPSKRNKLYPYPMAADQALAQRYHNLTPPNVYWMGRMGKYRYLDFGNILEDCYDLMEKIG